MGINTLDEAIESCHRITEKLGETGVRSNKRLVPLHGFIAKRVKKALGKDYEVNSLGHGSGKEDKLCGLLYNKTIDISVKRNGDIIAGISVKFPTSNFQKNAINFFEQMIGETFNIRGNDIIYSQILILPKSMPHRSNDGQSKEKKTIRNHILTKYRRLLNVTTRQYGVPNQFFMVFVLIDPNGEILIPDDLFYLSKQNELGSDFVEENIYRFYNKISDFDDFIKNFALMVLRK